VVRDMDNERYIVQLEVFEGPLDLLLHLISKHEIDIFDIPIAFITSKYLEYLNLMKQLNLDLASEYLEMAATLALIKSRMLVPSEPAGDDEELEIGPDPREELVRRLLEYQKYKTAAEALITRPMLGRDTFARGLAEEMSEDRELAAPGLFALLEAFHQIVARVDIDTSHHVTIIRTSVSERINQIVDLLRERRRVLFDDLFEGQQGISDLVVTFLSILEMSKLGLSRVHQAGTHGDIYITASDSLDASIDDLLKDLEEK
jgi:segregation and condensation protein A